MSRALLAVCLATLAGCGPANAAARNWQTGDFSRIRVEGPFDVTVHVGTPAGVHATGAQAAIDRLSVEQQGDVLVIRQVRTGGWSSWTGAGQDTLKIEVGARSLAAAMLLGSGDLAIDRVKGEAFEVALSGSGDLKIDDMQVRQLKATVTGSGDLTLAGRGDNATATLTGTGDVHGEGFVADQAVLALVGSGDLTMGAKRLAKVTLGGSGDVTVVGDAVCTVSKTGSGDVHCAHGGAE